mmetsp:Transcript_21147/g.59782  ORF Transcript_21147/g.59782 Transcript_21147/m.59782 type:complete len:248 (-) Transcript_21147:1157-1900(-)
MVPRVTKRQMWIFLCWPGRRTRPTACISKATASSGVAASMGCTMMTWLLAVRFVPLADSSSESSSRRGPSSSYWNLIRASRRAQTLPQSETCSTPNSSRARLILRLRSSHCTKQMTLQRPSSLCSRCTCFTIASIFDPYFAKPGAVSSTSTAATCVAFKVSWKDKRLFFFSANSSSSCRSRVAQRSTSAFHALTTLRSLSALSPSASHCHVNSSHVKSPLLARACSADELGLDQRGMPKLARSLVQR